MLDLAREFGFKIRAFHHAVEAYKIADLLARAGRRRSSGDWYGFKEEAMDGIKQNAALLQQGGARPHSFRRSRRDPTTESGSRQGDVDGSAPALR